MRALLGGLAGIAVVWLVCSFFAWDINPADWSAFLRFWAVLWAIPWTLFGAFLAHDDHPKRRVAAQKGVVIDA